MTAGDVSVNIAGVNFKDCAIFDGIDDKVEEDADPISAYPFSMSGWFVKTNEGASGVILSVANSTATNNFHGIFVGSTGNIRLMARNPTAYTIQGTPPIYDGQWHHVVGIWRSATDRELYLDNVSIGTSTESVIYTGINRWSIGRFGDSSPGGYHRGGIKDVRIYNRGLSIKDVENLYNGKDVNTGLIHQWKLETDYTDSIGSNDGTNSGTRLVNMENSVASNIQAMRNTANDKWAIDSYGLQNNEVLIVNVEEA